MQCEHYECRCARARELMAIADRTGQVRYLVEAIHLGSVQCRILEWNNRLASGDAGRSTKQSATHLNDGGDGAR